MFLVSLWTDNALQICPARKCFFLSLPHYTTHYKSSVKLAYHYIQFLYWSICPTLNRSSTCSKVSNTFWKSKQFLSIMPCMFLEPIILSNKRYWIMHILVPIILAYFPCTAFFNMPFYQNCPKALNIATISLKRSWCLVLHSPLVLYLTFVIHMVFCHSHGANP